jgi:hypothetical protein
MMIANVDETKNAIEMGEKTPESALSTLTIALIVAGGVCCLCIVGLVVVLLLRARANNNNNINNDDEDDSNISGISMHSSSMTDFHSVRRSDYGTVPTEMDSQMVSLLF